MQPRQAELLGQLGPHILYLWECSENLNILHEVAQTFKDGYEMDGDAPSALRSAKRPKKEKEELDLHEKFMLKMNANIAITNVALAQSNLDNKMESANDIRKQMREVQYKTWEMEDAGAPQRRLKVQDEFYKHLMHKLVEVERDIEQLSVELARLKQN